MKNMMKTNIMKKVEETNYYMKRGKKAKDEVEEPFDNLSAMKKLEEINYSIKDIKIEELIPNVIDNVIVYIEDTMIGKEVVQDIPSTMGGISFRNWRNNRGGIFARDIRAFIQGKTLANYAVLANKDQKVIVRFIEDDEMRIFSILNLLSGKIKDKPYMIFKKLEEGEEFTASKRYIEETSTTMMTEEKIPTIDTNLTHDEDGDRYSGTSVSLFDD